MYKGASASLQRRHKVIEVRKAASAYICEDDLIQTADNMSLEECKRERAQIILEKTRADNELIAAKACGNKRQIAALGHRLQGFSGRLGLLKRRISEIQGERRERAFISAAYEVLQDGEIKAVLNRRDEILAEGVADGQG